MTFSGGRLQTTLTTGNGLTSSGSTFSVNINSNGLTFSGSQVSLNIGTGLTFSSGQLAVSANHNDLVFNTSAISIGGGTAVSITVDMSKEIQTLSIAAGQAVTINSFTNSGIGKETIVKITSNETLFSPPYNYVNGSLINGIALGGTITTTSTTVTGTNTGFTTVNGTGITSSSILYLPSINGTTQYPLSGAVVSATSITGVSGLSSSTNIIGVVNLTASTDTALAQGDVVRIGGFIGTIATVVVSGRTYTMTSATQQIFNANLYKSNTLSFGVSGATTSVMSAYVQGVTNYLYIKQISGSPTPEFICIFNTIRGF